MRRPNKRSANPIRRSADRPKPAAPGNLARSAQGSVRSYAVGALPILNRILQRMKLEDFFRAYLPPDDSRTKLSPAKGLLVLLRNLLVSREPLYGMGEWAARYAPDLLGLSPKEVGLLNDDRVGRELDMVFLLDIQSLVLAAVTHVVEEFDVQLDQLHNDSTTVTFSGAYTDAATETRSFGHPTLAITFGHNKDHRPDLKQLLYILTVTEDGGVPIHFRTASGNTSDDQTHRQTWELLRQLTGRCDFLYVADCKLATTENLSYIAAKGGRFVSVLPRTRKEDTAFRQQLREGSVAWKPLWDKLDEQGQLVDRYSICAPTAATAEGYALFWYHSTRKAECDAAARAKRIDRALHRLDQLRRKVAMPRTRYRQIPKVQKAVEDILNHYDVAPWIHAQITPQEQETYRQAERGRPGKNTRYVRQVSTRLELTYTLDAQQVAAERIADGVFPLVSNVLALSAREVLEAYKHQPTIEKRFSQLKTDFAVAPMYLKDVRRIQALLCLYFFAMLVEALLERELRQAMAREGIESLPMYPEGRPCRWPTARRLIDLFENVQRHEMEIPGGQPVVLVTELTNLQRRILKLLGLSPDSYGV